jgi:hypothetical protein
VGDLLLKDLELGRLKLELAVNLGSSSRVLGDESTLLQDVDVFGEAPVLGEGLDIAHELVVGYSREGVADLGLEVLAHLDPFFGRDVLLQVGARLAL